MLDGIVSEREGRKKREGGREGRREGGNGVEWKMPF